MISARKNYEGKGIERKVLFPQGGLEALSRELLSEQRFECSERVS